MTGQNRLENYIHVVPRCIAKSHPSYHHGRVVLQRWWTRWPWKGTRRHFLQQNPAHSVPFQTSKIKTYYSWVNNWPCVRWQCRRGNVDTVSDCPKRQYRGFPWSFVGIRPSEVDREGCRAAAAMVVCCRVLLCVVVCCCVLLCVVVCCCVLLYVVVCCCVLLWLRKDGWEWDEPLCAIDGMSVNKKQMGGITMGLICKNCVMRKSLNYPIVTPYWIVICRSWRADCGLLRILFW